MAMRKKDFFAAIIIALFLTPLIVEATDVSAQSGTQVSGIISQDTTWTKANSPYTLTGAVGISKAATLTIQAGVTVNLQDTYIQVNGSLTAVGSSTEQIKLNNGRIIFTEISSSWNPQTNSGSIIQNAAVTSNLESNNVSPKIDHNILTGSISIGGSSTISNNTIKNDLSVVGGSPIIINNIFTNSLISTYSLQSSGLSPIISNNTMTGKGVKCYGGNGIGGYAVIRSNSISGCDTAIFGGASLIQNNYIFNNNIGIDTLNGIIQNNTITNNIIGINIPKDSFFFFGFGESPNNPTIAYNDFSANGNYSIYTTASNNVTAANNWWGTTDPQMISLQIYDFRKDFSIGNVTFSPILAKPNPQAMPNAAQIPPATDVRTFVSMRVEPNPVEVGSQITVYAFISPSPPSTNDQFSNLTLNIKRPDGTSETHGPFQSLANDSQLLSYTPTQVGNYSLRLTCAKQFFADQNVNYVPSDSAQLLLLVLAPQSPSPSETPSPTQSPSTSTQPQFTVGLSESASALNYGDRINFTVSVQGGTSPFNYTWFMDNQPVENGTSPFYSTEGQAVGSHHLYVVVVDADGNSANTLTVEFNVLPGTNHSASPTQQLTEEPSSTPNLPRENLTSVAIIVGAVIVIAVVLGLLVYLSKRKR